MNNAKYIQPCKHKAFGRLHAMKWWSFDLQVTSWFLYGPVSFVLYFMLSGRISRNIGENIFRSYTGTTSENTNFHVLVA